VHSFNATDRDLGDDRYEVPDHCRCNFPAWHVG